jgi:DHA2 family methylenomycin A resistance protein-like MFS transporter
MHTTSNSVAQQPSLAVLLASSFAFIIVQLDVTIVNVALPKMGAELGAEVSALQWVIDAYTLGFATFLLSAGVMGDKFGSKRVFLSGFALFTLASIACALAPSAMALNVARAVQGVGAALLVPSSLAILNSTYAHDKNMLAKAIGWWTAAGGVSIAAGPVIGGLLLSTAGWRSIFWVNVPICMAGFALTYAVVPRTASKAPASRFDLPGQLLSVLALAGFIGAVIEVQALGFSSLLVQGGFILALVAGAAFLIVESRTHAPMLPLKLFHSVPFSGAVLFGVLVNFAYYGVIFVLSFYLQSVRGFSVIQTGLTFLPLTGTFIFSNIASGRLSARTGLRTPMVLGGLIGGAGYAWLRHLGPCDLPRHAAGPGADPGRNGTGGAGDDDVDPVERRTAPGRNGVGRAEHRAPGRRRNRRCHFRRHRRRRQRRGNRGGRAQRDGDLRAAATGCRCHRVLEQCRFGADDQGRLTLSAT